MDLKKILLEKVYDPGEAKKRVPAKLTKSQLLKLKHKIKKYKRYGDSLNNETDLLDLSNTLNYIARGAKRYVETLDDIDDLDETMLKKDIKVLEDAATEFAKTAAQVVKLQQRMKASYEDMKYKLNRYFEMDDE